MKNFESNVEPLTRQVREAGKPGEKKKGKKMMKKRKNLKKTLKKRKDGKGKNKKNKKAKKGSGKRKTQKGRNRKSGGRRGTRPRVRTSSTCSNISCLNNLLQVLKVDKDTVANFMSQKKRMDSRLKLLLNKNNKSSKVNESLDHLALALGGNQSLRNNTPVCGGRYNNSAAQEVKLQNISRHTLIVNDMKSNKFLN